MNRITQKQRTKGIKGMKSLVSGILAGLISTATLASAQEIDPYAVTSNEVTLAKPATLQIDPEGVTILSPNLGKLSAKITPIVRNYMILWCQAQEGTSNVEWTVHAPADGKYRIDTTVIGKNSGLVLSTGDQKLEATIKESGWHRRELGELSLKAGENTLTLDIEAVVDPSGGARGKHFQLSALELTKPSVKAAMEQEALAMRQQPDWFKDAGYGLMFQWTNRASPPQGPIKEWEEKVNDFDLDGFMNLVDESGASYVIWSVTWGNQYISAPVKALDALIAGRTTRRDLLGEMANRLDEKGVKLIFYYHYGYECYHSQDRAWLEASGGLQADKTELYNNLMKIISEVSARYGEKLHGWWFDGGARYVNCHFDGSSGSEGILSAPFKAYTAAARVGNDKRLVAYNSWIKPFITEYQDYYGGEGTKLISPDNLENGVLKGNRIGSLQAHGCFPLEKRWGHIDLDTKIENPKYSLAQLKNFVKKAQKNRYPLSINLEMYEDGSVSPESQELLKKLKEAIISKNEEPELK